MIPWGCPRAAAAAEGETGRGRDAMNGDSTKYERPGDRPLRLALISTPRSGNTWARALLANLYDLVEIPVHRPDEIDWENLPKRCVIQLHWYHEESFIE